jgi:hypothetical protein
VPVISAFGKLRQEDHEFQANLGKVCETPSQPIKLGVVVHTCRPNHVGTINRRIMIQAVQGIKMKPYFKNSQSKKG